MRKTTKKLLAAVLSMAMVVTSFTGIGAANDAKTASAAVSSVWKEDGYHAYLYYQTKTWDYRDPLKTGKEYSYVQAGGQDVTEKAEITDVLLKEGDGEYTVKISGVDLTGADAFNMMGISTDIPLKSADSIKVTDATLKIDGNEVEGTAGVELPHTKSYEANGYSVFSYTGYDGWNLSSTIPFKQGKLTTMPKSDIEISFKITGVPKFTKTYGKKAGATFTSGNYTYKVATAATEDTNGKVAITKLSTKGKKAKTLSVPNTVKASGATYTVSAVNANVFKAAKATSVTLGKGVTKIASSAFANCKKLTKLVVNGKLSSVAKNAFKGCTKKISISGSSVDANAKKIKAAGAKSIKKVYTPIFATKYATSGLVSGKAGTVAITAENVKSVTKVIASSADEKIIKIKNEKTSGLTYSAEIFGEAAGSAKVTFKIAYKRMDGKTATKTITKDVTVADGGFYGHLEDKDITLRVKLPETSTNVGEERTVPIKGGTSANMIVKDNGTVRKDVSTQWLIENEMGEGVNLGNTLEATLGTYADKVAATDATVFEQAWGQPITTEAYIQSLRSYGFNTIRIPVAWSNMDSEDGTYTINEKYLGRVEEVVNYALNCGMYVIVNDHWDSQWWGQFGACKEDADGNKFADETKRAEAWKRYERYWTQICDRFKDYSDHLIFEGANEELGDRLNDAIYESGYCVPKDDNDTKAISGNLTEDERYEMANKINQKFVDIVRSTGGNNAYRHLLIAGYDTNIDKTCDDKFKMPTDTAENGTTKLSVSVHYYTPWDFCGDGGSGIYTQKDKEATETYFTKMDKFYNAGYGIIMGEFSVCNPKQEGVAQWLNDTMTIAAKHHILPVLWETNQYMDKDNCKMRYNDIAVLYNTITGSTGDTSSKINTNGTTTDGSIADYLETTNVNNLKAGFEWTGKWYKNGGGNLVGDDIYTTEEGGTKVTKGSVEAFVPESSSKSSIDGDTTELGFNDWGYQAFLKIDLSKYKKPVVAFNFLDISDTEDFVETVTIGTSDKVGGSGKNTYDLKYSEFHGKGIVLNDTLLKALETEPYLYITFAGKPAVTGITVYEG